MPSPHVIEPEFHPRIWGSRDLRAWYPERSLEIEPIGEAWLSPPGSPVLVKFLFPNDRLSVQVHPDDAYAEAHGLVRGKSEMWYVLEATPEARLGVGLRSDADFSCLGDACREGRAAELLHWMPVKPGDVIDVPAGTVHAIASGVVLCEVQQQSDNTFRLDDYGRVDGQGKRRPLHLERGLAVARRTTAGKIAHGLGVEESGTLLVTPFFRVVRHCIPSASTWRVDRQETVRWIVNVGRSRPNFPRGHALEIPAGENADISGPAIALEVAAVGSTARSGTL